MDAIGMRRVTDNTEVVLKTIQQLLETLAIQDTREVSDWIKTLAQASQERYKDWSKQQKSEFTLGLKKIRLGLERMASSSGDHQQRAVRYLASVAQPSLVLSHSLSVQSE